MAKVVNKQVIDNIEIPVEIKREDSIVEAFYYNTITYTDLKNTFKIYAKYESGRMKEVASDLCRREAIEQVLEINSKLGINRAERLYNL